MRDESLPAEARSLRLVAPAARALYLHIPFCQSKCAYCDFPSRATRPDDDAMRRYVIGLQHLVEHAAYIGLLDECSTAYVGGGTPSLLGERLFWLCETIDRAIEVRELTCEANPESLDERLLDQILRAGATRVSIGVQSLSPRELRALGRIHTSRRARRAIEEAVASGLDVSCDLMCGIPLQTAASWRNAVSGVLSLGIEHLSVYPLILEEGTPLAAAEEAGEVEVGDDDAAARRMQTAERMAAGAGLVRYEVASYAVPGRECIHNIAYWTGQPYLGLGTAAASMLTRQGYERLRGACPSLPELPDAAERVRLKVLSTPPEIIADEGLGGLRFEVEFLDGCEAMAEDLMLAMRMVCGAPAALLSSARARFGTRALGCAIDDVLSQGLARLDESGSLVPTERGWLLGNALFGRMWDLAS